MKTTKDASKGITFQFQGLAGLLVDPSRTEARKIRALIRIFDHNDLLAVSSCSTPLQKSPTEDASSNLVRHVAVWEENSITVRSTSRCLRLHILLKFPSGSTLSIGQCDWTPSSSSSSSSENLQVHAFRWEEAAVRMDTEGDAVLRVRVTHSRKTNTPETPRADSLGSLDYSFSQSETMLDTTDLIGFSVAMEGNKKVPKSPTLRKPKDRLVSTIITKDRLVVVSPAMAMDPLAIRRMFRARPEPVVVNEPPSQNEVSSVQSTGSGLVEQETESPAPPKSASLTVSPEHLDYLAKQKTQVVGPSASDSSHEDDDQAPSPVRSVTPTPVVPPVESIEFEKQEMAVSVPVVTPEKAVLKPVTPLIKKKSSKRLFHSKKMKKKKKNEKRLKSLLALEDRDEIIKPQDVSPVPKRFAKIKSFFKRPWTSEKFYCEESDAAPAAKGKESKADTTEMNYALLSASSCKPPPEDESTDVSRSIGETRSESLLQVRDQNVTPVDEFYSSALMENYFSGKPCVDGAAHITPETVTTVATTPERAVKALLHQPFLGEETPDAPNGQNSKDNDVVTNSLACTDCSPIQIGDDGEGDNLSAIPEKSSPTSSSSNNWSNGTPVHAAPARKNEEFTTTANCRTIGASTSFDAEIHGTPVSNDLASQGNQQDNGTATSPLCTGKNEWETFDGNFAAEQPWVASTFNSSDSAFSEISLRWRQKQDNSEPQQPMWESLLIPPVKDTMNGHVHGERIQIQLKSPPQDTSQSYDSQPTSTEPVVPCSVESIISDKMNLQTASDENNVLFFSRSGDEAIKNKQSEEGDHWIVFDGEARLGGTRASHLVNEDEEEEVDLLHEDTDVHGIGLLVDWNVGEVFDPTEAFEDAVQDLDTVSDKENDVIVTTTEMNLDYSILSEELMMDLLPSRNATPERTVDASPGRMAFLLSKSPKTPFPLATRPAESIDTDKEITKVKSWQKNKSQNKTFARRLKDGLFGILVCGSHVKVLSTDDDDGECESDDDSHSYADSYPIWLQTHNRNSAQIAGRKKGLHASKKRRFVHNKPSNNKKVSIPPSHLGKQRDYRMHKTFSDGGSPPIHDRVLSPALSDAEDLAWAKASASRHWV
ncbi:hypothetical protein FisN_27Lh085 [Fistulifera solaris]|uniref:Uncharacterized protein n=1 Tax=Fistulifera solaris TaxID=1519565 RepID=A0A1Z5JQT3_FISSO|nr:hypothetical protein FisN_27Lh085 [Fistulifera solaris]|eukprot:GAX16374.1 hypothetical protein FisN_27Lh085 [Fistulifera solaris]